MLKFTNLVSEVFLLVKVRRLGFVASRVIRSWIIRFALGLALFLLFGGFLLDILDRLNICWGV